MSPARASSSAAARRRATRCCCWPGQTSRGNCYGKGERGKERRGAEEGTLSRRGRLRSSPRRLRGRKTRRGGGFEELFSRFFLVQGGKKLKKTKSRGKKGGKKNEARRSLNRSVTSFSPSLPKTINRAFQKAFLFAFSRSPRLSFLQFLDTR